MSGSGKQEGDSGEIPLPPAAPPQQPPHASPPTAGSLFELDDPGDGLSREVAFDAVPDREEAPDLQPAASRPAPVEPFASARPRTSSSSLLPATRSLTPATAPPDADPAELRLRRLVVRVQTARDAYRLLGALGLDESSRREVARSLMELETLAGRPAEGPALMKDPQGVLERASAEALEQVEAKLSSVEDRLLQLDELVPRDTFRRRVAKGKLPRKHLARYARLLASRRLPAGPRRDRFEWLATLLLTTPTPDRRLELLPADRARPVLQHLVGGLLYKARDAERSEALATLRDAYDKLDGFASAEAFFESGLFLDVHGFKVSMRDQLANPDFLYLSVALNAKLHNLLEGWIAALEHTQDEGHEGQIASAATARAQVLGRLREQEQAVDTIFGVRPRARSPAAPRPATEPPRSLPAQPPKRKRKKRSLDFAFDAEMIKLLLIAAVILGSGAFVLVETGTVGEPAVEMLDEAKLDAISPLLVRGWIRGSGSDRYLDAMLHRSRWRDLEPRARSEAAERMASSLAARDVQKAEVKLGKELSIRIDNGLVLFVSGGL